MFLCSLCGKIYSDDTVSLKVLLKQKDSDSDTVKELSTETCCLCYGLLNTKYTAGINNTFEVATNSSISQNTFEKNYWGKYTGYDLDGDGFGDVPHRPVSLSSLLIENTNSSFIFVHSPLFFLLDKIESALPSFGPENLLDKTPLISPPAELL